MGWNDGLLPEEGNDVGVPAIVWVLVMIFYLTGFACG